MKPALPSESTLLVVGYGNTLRRDDGAGCLVADRVEALGLDGVRVLSCPQLTPDVAAQLAGVATVVFVDATVAATTKVGWRSLAPDDTCPVSTHATDPRALLALARELYGHAPAAWLLTVPTELMGFGTDLSEVTSRGIEAAVKRVTELAHSLKPLAVGP